MTTEHELCDESLYVVCPCLLLRAYWFVLVVKLVYLIAFLWVCVDLWDFLLIAVYLGCMYKNLKLYWT